MFGFGKGNLEIQINKLNFSPGETIDGNVLLKLNKPVKAKELSIRFYGDERVPRMTHKGRPSTKTIIVYEFKQSLDGEKKYPANEELIYPFKIKIPPNVPRQTAPHDAIGTVLQTAQLLSGARGVCWYLVSNLNIPWAFDIDKKVQITIS